MLAAGAPQIGFEGRDGSVVNLSVWRKPMNRSLELPEGVYAELVRAAEAGGQTPAGWIQERLPKNGVNGTGTSASDEELAAADAALDDCLVSLGHPLGADNKQIDADLAREYGDDHADLYGPSERK
jgi:hypothetical protein